ncbi:hypothetical protein B1992_00700 [Pseudoxanthomonas broegbernensis]|uniref:Uncharacterized protein n=1 Tax=Pseudoxanthomonas broegbernensis TaxID=83619 RepID=A0A7V8GPZ6_9GAMM|nr:hypothetical protein [Pseudoxanthomonas broegbernensis]KAF1687990.1 hypothetical protein B1992_00700 [Pseudoxanthomonas broegbernensis]MBB6065006.1 hypothetical protein [Pseudoxanthomonas broegbernensis]
MNHNDPLTPEERELATWLAQAADAGPSPAADARILAAARQAVGADTDTTQAATGHAAPIPLARHRRRRRAWPTAMGLAASVALAVGVAWQLREPPRPQAATEAAADLPAAAVNGDARRAPSARDEAVAADIPSAIAPARAPTRAAAPIAIEPTAPSPAGAEKATAARSAGSAGKAAAEAVAERALPVPPPPPPAPIAPAAPVPSPAAPVPSPRADVMARPRPAPDTTMRAAEDTARMAAPPPPMDMAEPPPAASAPAPARALQADAFHADDDGPAAHWLQRIREQREHGDLDGARASLARFARSHPGYPIPHDLRPLLPPAPP